MATKKKSSPKTSKSTQTPRSTQTSRSTRKNPSKAAPAYALKPGDKAPLQPGLKEYKGKGFVLYFYPKDNTPGCTLEGQDFKRLYPKFSGLGYQIIGVSRDSVASHEKFREKCGFPFPLVSDEAGELCKAYDVIQMKSLYGRKFLGIERSTFVVDEKGIVRGEWRKVKVNGHADEVLELVRGLESGAEP